MKRSLFILLIAIASCQSFSRSEKPDDFYGDDKMAAIMADLYLFQGVVNSNRSALIKNGALATDLIYDKYKTDSITFKQNLEYYVDREEEYLLLIEQVEQLLEQEKDSVSKRQEKINLESQEFKSTPITDSLPAKDKERKIRQDLL